MDLLTHGFVPYAILTWLKRPRSHRAIAALGGMAPDLDAAWGWASHAHDLAYPLVHRGFSHTLWGAPVLATLLLYLMSRPRLHKRWPRLRAFHWTPDALLPLWLGSFSHLVLDGLTITGAPVLWPFETTRYTLNWFFYGIFLLLPFSLFGLVQLARGKASDRAVKRISVILLVIFLVAGGLRLASYPFDRDAKTVVTPGPVDVVWYVTSRNETGTSVYAAGLLTRDPVVEFFPEPNRTAAADAIRACEASPGYVPFGWDAWAPPTANATQRTDGGWQIEFRDPVQRYVERHPLVRPPWRIDDSEPEGVARCTVTAEGDVRFARDRGWFGS